MPRFSRAQEQALNRIGNLSARGLLPDLLGEELVAELDRAIPADGWVLYGLDPYTLLYNRVLAQRSVLPEARALIAHYLTMAYLVHEPPALTPPGLMRASIPVTLFRDQLAASRGIPPELIDEQTGTHWAEFFHEDVGAPPGGTLSAHFAAHGVWIAALDALRLEAQHPFRPTDAAFLRYVSPRIGAALNAALNRERALQHSQPGVSPSGVIMLAPNGSVQVCTPAAQRWIERMRDRWLPEAPGRIQLPTAVWAAVARFRTSTPQGVPGGLMVSTPAGPLQIEATAGGSDGSIVVVLTPQLRPRSLRLPDEWGLTSSERTVALRVMQGLSNRAVASHIGIGEHTVEFHLGNLYEKLGVRGRSELLARLFRDVYWPEFQFPAGDDTD